MALSMAWALLVGALVGVLHDSVAAVWARAGLPGGGWAWGLAAGLLVLAGVLLGTRSRGLTAAWRLGRAAAGRSGTAAGAWVVEELGRSRELGQIVQGQLGSVVQETEKAAYDISSRLAQIDGKVTQLDEVVANSIVDVSRRAADSTQEIDGNKALLEAMNVYIRFRMEESERDQHRVSQVIQQAKSLASLVELIKGIAHQTNLLSLNAAIEAARVGEAGRGFAVVATEVRMLSRETESAVNQINQGISSMAEAIHVQFHEKVTQEHIDKERRTLQQFASQLDTLNQKYGELISAQSEVAQTIGQSSEEIKSLFMDAMASVQFQDITRQQVEQVVATLAHLDEHYEHLAERLRQADAPDFEQHSIDERKEQIFNAYVMDSQRAQHRMGASEAAKSDEVALKVELF